jgi:hypothetical protein
MPKGRAYQNDYYYYYITFTYDPEIRLMPGSSPVA